MKVKNLKNKMKGDLKNCALSLLGNDQCQYNLPHTSVKTSKSIRQGVMIYESSCEKTLYQKDEIYNRYFKTLYAEKVTDVRKVIRASPGFKKYLKGIIVNENRSMRFGKNFLYRLACKTTNLLTIKIYYLENKSVEQSKMIFVSKSHLQRVNIHLKYVTQREIGLILGIRVCFRSPMLELNLGCNLCELVASYITCAMARRTRNKRFAGKTFIELFANSNTLDCHNKCKLQNKLCLLRLEIPIILRLMVDTEKKLSDVTGLSSCLGYINKLIIDSDMMKSDVEEHTTTAISEFNVKTLSFCLKEGSKNTLHVMQWVQSMVDIRSLNLSCSNFSDLLDILESFPNPKRIRDMALCITHVDNRADQDARWHSVCARLTGIRRLYIYSTCGYILPIELYIPLVQLPSLTALKLSNFVEFASDKVIKRNANFFLQLTKLHLDFNRKVMPTPECVTHVCSLLRRLIRVQLLYLNLADFESDNTDDFVRIFLAIAFNTNRLQRLTLFLNVAGFRSFYQIINTLLPALKYLRRLEIVFIGNHEVKLELFAKIDLAIKTYKRRFLTLMTYYGDEIRM